MAGFDKFLEYSKKWTDPKLLSDLSKFIENFLKKQGFEVIANTKLDTPVKTGALRNAWQLGNMGILGDVYMINIENNQEYASYVEYGHAGVYVPALGVTMFVDKKFTKGHFMLSKAMNKQQQKMHKDFEREFTKFLNSKGIG